MRAKPGDRLVIPSPVHGRRAERAKVLEALGPEWGPPFLVQWASDGRIEVVVPGPEAWVEHFSQMPAYTAAS